MRVPALSSTARYPRDVDKLDHYVGQLSVKSTSPLLMWPSAASARDFKLVFAGFQPGGARFQGVRRGLLWRLQGGRRAVKVRQLQAETLAVYAHVEFQFDRNIRAFYGAVHLGSRVHQDGVSPDRSCGEGDDQAQENGRQRNTADTAQIQTPPRQLVIEAWLPDYYLRAIASMRQRSTEMRGD